MNTSLRLLVASALVAGTAATTLSAPSHAAPSSERRGDPYDVSLTASTDELVLGKRVVLRGQVRPGASGQQVLLQKRIEGKDWVVEKKSVLDDRGRYVFKDEPSTVQPRKYRVVKPATTKHAKGVSNVVSVAVYQWRNLTSLYNRDGDYYSYGTATIDTVEHPDSLRSYFYDGGDTEGFIDYNLERQCLTLDARFGMDDDADVDSTVRIEVYADDATPYSQSFELLESERRRLDLRGVFRLGFTWTSTGPADSIPVAAVATPRVLCAF